LQRGPSVRKRRGLAECVTQQQQQQQPSGVPAIVLPKGVCLRQIRTHSHAVLSRLRQQNLHLSLITENSRFCGELVFLQRALLNCWVLRRDIESAIGIFPSCEGNVTKKREVSVVNICSPLFI
jgi:hypothetical protein